MVGGKQRGRQGGRKGRGGRERIQKDTDLLPWESASQEKLSCPLLIWGQNENQCEKSKIEQVRLSRTKFSWE